MLSENRVYFKTAKMEAARDYKNVKEYFRAKMVQEEAMNGLMKKYEEASKKLNKLTPKDETYLRLFAMVYNLSRTLKINFELDEKSPYYDYNKKVIDILKQAERTKVGVSTKKLQELLKTR